MGSGDGIMPRGCEDPPRCGLAYQDRLQQRKFVKVQDSHPHNPHIRSNCCTKFVYVSKFRKCHINVVKVTVAVHDIQTFEDYEYLSACC